MTKVIFLSMLLALSSIFSLKAQIQNEPLIVNLDSGALGIELNTTSGGSNSPHLLFDARTGRSASQVFMQRQEANNLVFKRFTNDSPFTGGLALMHLRGNGYVSVPGRIGIGSYNPSEKLHVVGNMYLDNDQNSSIFFPKHNLTIGTKPNNYYHNTVNFKPGGSNSGALHSTLALYTANSPSNHTLKTKITSNGTSYFNGGNLGVGTTDTKGYKLAVNGKAIATGMKIQSYDSWPDYVFTRDYQLMPLEEVDAFISSKGHLPNIPSAKEITEAKGFEVEIMNKLLLEKIEELTLYTIQQQKKIYDQKQQLDTLDKKVEKLMIMFEKNRD